VLVADWFFCCLCCGHLAQLSAGRLCCYHFVTAFSLFFKLFSVLPTTFYDDSDKFLCPGESLLAALKRSLAIVQQETVCWLLFLKTSFYIFTVDDCDNVFIIDVTFCVQCSLPASR
jgi:hypothetical protein